METMARHSYERTQPGLYNQRVIPEVPRLRARRTGRLHRHPLVVYSIFVSVSLVLLGSMAVASLPM
jgi:hypothetical protein